ncbi:MAG: right-handed parallel beta-helix repeat-containing protein [Acidimicrobiales bacterium]
MGLVRAATVLSISVIVLASVGAPATAAELYVVPPSIDPSGTRDVTADLITFVAGVPDGSTIVFQPGGRYRIEGTFLTEARHNLVFEGNNAAFFATTEGIRNRSHWRFNHSTGITVRDVVVTGANEDAGVDGPYLYEREAQHGFAIEGSSDVTLERVRVTDVWGDLVYIDKHAGVNSQRVSVRDSFLEGSGRQGLGIAAGEDIIIERNWIAGIRRSTIALEPHNPNQGIRRVLIRDNEIGPGRFYFVAAGGMAAPMEDITILHNRMHGKVPSVTVRGHPQLRRQRIIIAGNVSDTNSNHPVFTFRWVDGVLVVANTVALREPKEAISAVETFDSCYVTVAGNDFGEAGPLAVMSANSCPGRNAIGLPPE